MVQYLADVQLSRDNEVESLADGKDEIGWLDSDGTKKCPQLGPYCAAAAHFQYGQMQKKNE